MPPPPRESPPPPDEPATEQIAPAPGSETMSNRRLLSSSGGIAFATLISRITGFVKQVLLLTVLGGAIASSFTVASQIPNMIAELVLGAVLTAIVVPVLVRAEREDADAGVAFVRRLFTAASVVLVLAALLATAAAPVLTTHVFLSDEGRVNTDLTTALSFLLLPAILFYGLSALFTAILNTRQVFLPGAWAPVLNNVVVLVILGAYLLVPGEISLDPVRMSDPKLLVLGLGVLAGVVTQAGSLWFALRRRHVDLRPLWGLDARLRQFGGMAVAIVLYVLISQAGFIFATRVSSHVDAAGPAIYNNAWLLLQLPYGVLGVTVLTAIMPRLSRNAAADDTPAVVDDLSVATRLTMLALIPVVTFLTLAGGQVGTALYGYGNFTADAERLGHAVSWSAFTLIPYALVLIQLRVFYAREEAWTPTWIILGVTAVKVALSALAPFVASNDGEVVSLLGVANGVSFIVGAVIGGYLLHRSLGHLRMANIARAVGQVLAASLAGAVVMLVLDRLGNFAALTSAFGGVGAVLRVAIDATAMMVVTLAILRVLRVPEVVSVMAAVSRRLRRGGTDDTPDREPPDHRYDPVMEDETTALPVSGGGRIETVRPMPVPYPGPRQPLHGPGPGSGYPSDPSRYEGAQVSDDPTPGAGTPEPKSAPTGSSGTDTGVLPPTPPPVRAPGVPRRPHQPPRGPRLIPGASVAGGRYRLLASHGGARGLKFWQALDVKLDREVALTFVDANQTAGPGQGHPDQESNGPQAILSRTLRLGRINSPGLARVLDVVRGSSGGIVVAEWTPGRSLREMAEAAPSPIGAAHAIHALAAAAELAHRGGGALSIDHPDRVRISTAGDAVLAFPGTLADADPQSDVRGLGAMLYALVTARWPLGTPSTTVTGTAAPPSPTVGGLHLARRANGVPVEPHEVRPEVPYEISAVAMRALETDRGVRTAATVAHVLEQAAVVDQQTDLIPALRLGQRPPGEQARALTDPAVKATEKERSRRMVMILFGLGALTVLLLGLVGWWLANALAGGSSDGGLSDEGLGLTTNATAPAEPGAPTSPAGVPVPATAVEVISPQGTPDDPTGAPYVLDNDPSTMWQTDAYFQQFPALKNGVGLLATLPAPTNLTHVWINSPSPGTHVEIRTSPNASPTLDQTQVIGTATLEDGLTEIPVRSTAPTTYVLIWITQLGGGGTQNQTMIADIGFTAAP
ncbi:MAG TPA: lipid II flippase MurJ [Aldersonia sp.]